MDRDAAPSNGATLRELRRSPSLLRLRMIELSNSLRTQHLPKELADEIRASIASLRRAILEYPSLSLADLDAKTRTARGLRYGSAA